jgi:hypothetical protein
MFLEIHDKDRNDIVIYSQNFFDMEENFKIIYKDALQKKHQKIKISDVYDFVNYPVPKNLIVYRLLTNYDAINAADSKYGSILFIDNKDELIYFDPIFALKDLPNLVKDYNLQSFRFKIQQFGIRTLSFVNGKERFTEVFSYDLYALEAQNQNDKIFADALFPEETDFLNTEGHVVFGSNGELEEHLPESSTELHINNLKEDSSPEHAPFKKPVTNDISSPTLNKFEQKELLKKVLGIDDIRISSQLPQQKSDKDDTISDIESSDQYSNLFKKTTSGKKPEERGKDSIVLKITKL